MCLLILHNVCDVETHNYASPQIIMHLYLMTVIDPLNLTVRTIPS